MIPGEPALRSASWRWLVFLRHGMCAQARSPTRVRLRSCIGKYAASGSTRIPYQYPEGSPDAGLPEISSRFARLGGAVSTQHGGRYNNNGVSSSLSQPQTTNHWNTDAARGDGSMLVTPVFSLADILDVIPTHVPITHAKLDMQVRATERERETRHPDAYLVHTCIVQSRTDRCSTCMPCRQGYDFVAVSAVPEAKLHRIQDLETEVYTGSHVTYKGTTNSFCKQWLPHMTKLNMEVTRLTTAY